MPFSVKHGGSSPIGWPKVSASANVLLIESDKTVVAGALATAWKYILLALVPTILFALSLKDKTSPASNFSRRVFTLPLNSLISKSDL